MRISASSTARPHVTDTGISSKDFATSWVTRIPLVHSSAISGKKCTTHVCCASSTGWLTIHLHRGALDAAEHVQQWAPAVILSDGDAVFQLRKVERSGLWQAFDGHMLIYIHKEEELAHVERLYPAHRYVMIDDKLRILDSMKKIWGDRLTTIFPQQRHYATGPRILALYPHGDLQLGNIGDLVRCELADLVRQ